MSKRLLEVFDEDFLRELRQARNHPEAYELATQKWEKEHGFTPFNGYDAFRKKKSRRFKKRR